MPKTPPQKTEDWEEIAIELSRWCAFDGKGPINKEEAKNLISFIHQLLEARDSYWLKKIEERLPGKMRMQSEFDQTALGWNACLSEIKKRLLK